MPSGVSQAGAVGSAAAVAAGATLSNSILVKSGMQVISRHSLSRRGPTHRGVMIRMLITDHIGQPLRAHVLKGGFTGQACETHHPRKLSLPPNLVGRPCLLGFVERPGHHLYDVAVERAERQRCAARATKVAVSAARALPAGWAPTRPGEVRPV